MVALPSWFRFRARFSRLEAGRKRATATVLGVYRPHRQRFPVGNRLTLVALGFSGPPRLAAVWWISLLSSHLRLKNLLSAWPPFLIPEIGAAPCRPDVHVSLMCLAMKKRPAVVTWFLFANLGLTYNIQVSFQLSQK